MKSSGKVTAISESGKRPPNTKSMVPISNIFERKREMIHVDCLNRNPRLDNDLMYNHKAAHGETKPASSNSSGKEKESGD